MYFRFYFFNLNHSLLTATDVLSFILFHYSPISTMSILYFFMQI